MTRLEDLLSDAGDGPVGFDHGDVARRVRHRRRRNRLAAVVGLVLVVASVGVVGTLGDDEQTVDSTGPVEDGAVTVEELVEDRWVAQGYSAPISPPGAAFLDFSEDRTLAGTDGCNRIEGEWELDGGRLETTLRAREQASCAVETGDLNELLQGPAVGRFDGASGPLQIRAGDDWVVFERFDRLGAEPTAATIEGTWAPAVTADPGDELGPTPGTVTFSPDGTGRLEVGGCSTPFRWTLDGDLSVEGVSPDGVPCDGGVVGGGLVLHLTDSPRLRTDGSTLWISSRLGVLPFRAVQEQPKDGTTSTTTSTTTTDAPDDAGTALEQAAQSARFVTASPEGVFLHEGSSSTQVTETPAAVAFATGPDTVVYQPARQETAVFPPGAEGAPRVWTDGEERDLPVGDDVRRIALLGVAAIDDAPVALIAETYGGVGPEDTFEELVLVDLRDDTRTTVVRRPSWESGHVAGRVLPDGDIVGLFVAEAHTYIARWTAGADDPVWSTEVAVDSRRTLTMRDGTITVVESAFDDDFRPVLTISSYGTDGSALSSESLTIADPDEDLGAGLHCIDWYDESHLACARGDGPPILVSTTARTFTELPQTGTGAIPRIVPPG